jgi:hypothetical protein
MTAYQAVVVSAAREWTCKHRHRGELAAFGCALRQVRQRVNGRLHGDPRPPGRARFFMQFSAFTREVPQ